MPNDLYLDEQLIARIRGIQIRARHLVNDTFLGEYKSAFKGRGLEFEEVREYQPGDDIRTIDWNVTARMNHPFIKRHRDERELTVMFVVDVSGSSKFGTIDRFKNETAAELTALLAYAALKNNDKVGLLIFSDRVEHYIPPKKGRAHIWRLIREILSFEPNSKNTDFEKPLSFLNQVLKKKVTCFLVSDFQVDQFETILSVTSRRHDLVAISIQDPREVTLPNIGLIELEDAESGMVTIVDTSKSKVRTTYKSREQQRQMSLSKFFQGSKIDHIQIQMDKPYLDVLVRFFKSRESRSIRSRGALAKEKSHKGSSF
ncbi:MAG: DUF58 domain-containing protein [Bdellovibrionales bacterium]|nr:DUF58 domain-containing protein [Bdellovibrionales bacterium]